MLSQTSRAAMKPKLSLSINTSTSSVTSTRPSLSLKSPASYTSTPSSSSAYSSASTLRSPISPSPVSPTARNTRLNQRGYSTMQQPSYAYINSSSARSILKKKQQGGVGSGAGARRQLSFDDKPMVYCVTPIEGLGGQREEYYGSSVRMGRDERRWGRR